jgi:hypothetical protein
MSSYLKGCPARVNPLVAGMILRKHVLTNITLVLIHASRVQI